MRSRPGTKVYTIKLTPEEWEELGRIAEREGCLWGGLPNRSEAVRRLIERDRDASAADRSGPMPER